MFLIIGLGNHGFLYQKNRHNIGFKVIKILSQVTEIKVNQRKCKAKIGKGVYRYKEIILAKPQTYMNNSGEVVINLVQTYNIDPSKIIVVYDDLDLTLGKIKIRAKGSCGGHKGLRSILECLNTQEIKRVRVGINPGFKVSNSSGFVLSNFTPEEDLVINEVILRTVQAILSIIEEGLDIAMNIYN
ncbi:aminoacyl-tRNA hydrolase [bacterium]|nr:aminoacyl-tRNA hydrolase [bacterium]